MSGFSGGGGAVDIIPFGLDLNTALVVGQPIYEVPFEADPKAYVYRVPYWQLRGSFQTLALDVLGPFGGFHVGEVQGSFRDIQGGTIIEFWREFALVPDLRSEYESFVYSYQVLGYTLPQEGAATYQLAELPFTVKSRVQYDYFQTTSPNTDIQLYGAPRIVPIPSSGTSIHYYFYNNWGSYPNGGEILAEDGTIRHWKGNIYERKQRFIKWVNFQNALPP